MDPTELLDLLKDQGLDEYLRDRVLVEYAVLEFQDPLVYLMQTEDLAVINLYLDTYKYTNIIGAINQSVRLQNLDILKHLTQYGSPNAATFRIALEVGNLEIAKYLREYRLDVRWDPYYNHSTSHSIEFSKYILTTCGPDTIKRIKRQCIVKGGSLELIRYMHEDGLISFDLQDGVLAIERERDDVFYYIYHACEWHGSEWLPHACRSNKVKIVEFLLNQGVEICGMEEAIRHNSVGTAKLLLKRGCFVSEDHVYLSLLHCPEMYNLFLENYKPSGKIYLSGDESTEVVQRILNSEYDLDIEDLLEQAVKFYNAPLIRFLVDRKYITSIQLAAYDFRYLEKLKFSEDKS